MTIKESRILPEAERFMARALALAKRAVGRTDPNPMVGAVLVKDGRIVGQGYHRAAGKPHAEVEAIRDAGIESRGAELFVTLEPCNHHGRTPPCTLAVLEAGIVRVWYGMADPNPAVSGGGAHFLRERGLEVIGPVLEDRCRALNEVFLTNVLHKRPFVFLKLAMSLDGRIATRTGHSQWITSETSRGRVHKVRDRVSGVMVGIGTLLADNPSLTTRLRHKRGHDSIRIVVDSTLRTPSDAAVFDPNSPAGVIIACCQNPPTEHRKRLEAKGATVVPTSGAHQVDLTNLLDQLYGIGITSILIEGGAQLAWGALKEKIVDRCIFFYAPMIIGGRAAPSGVGGDGTDRLEQAPRLIDVQTFRTGPDLLVTGRVDYPLPR